MPADSVSLWEIQCALTTCFLCAVIFGKPESIRNDMSASVAPSHVKRVEGRKMKVFNMCDKRRGH